MKLFNNLVLKFMKKEKETKRPSLIMELINNPDLAEINIKKEGDEIVIRVRRVEDK